MKVLTVQVKTGNAVQINVEDEFQPVLNENIYGMFPGIGDTLFVPMSEISFVMLSDAAPEIGQPPEQNPDGPSVEEMRQELAAVSRYVDPDASDEEIAALYAATYAEPVEVG